MHPILDKGIGRIVSKAANRVSRAGSEDWHIPSEVLSTVMQVSCIYTDIYEILRLIVNFIPHQCLFPDSPSKYAKSEGWSKNSSSYNSTATDYSWHPLDKNSSDSTVS